MNNGWPSTCAWTNKIRSVLPSGNIFVQYYNEAIIIDQVTLDIIKQLPNVPGSVSTPLGGRNYPWEGPYPTTKNGIQELI